LIAIFRCFGSPEAMRLEAREGFCGTPGLTLEEANALVRYRMKRGECFAPNGAAGPETTPPARAERAGPAEPATPARAERAGPATPAQPGPPPPRGLYRIFKHGRMWFMDPKTKKIVGPAPL